MNGKRQTWPYAQLVTHQLEGGVLKIWFSQHAVTIRGRHLETADAGLHLQSLVYLEENGVRRKEALGEPEIPEDQPAIDSIMIHRKLTRRKYSAVNDGTSSRRPFSTSRSSTRIARFRSFP